MKSKSQVPFYRLFSIYRGRSISRHGFPVSHQVLYPIFLFKKSFHNILLLNPWQALLLAIASPIFGQANSTSIRPTPARGSISHGLFYKDNSKISTCTLSIPFLIPLILRERELAHFLITVYFHYLRSTTIVRVSILLSIKLFKFHKNENLNLVKQEVQEYHTKRPTLLGVQNDLTTLGAKLLWLNCSPCDNSNK